MLLQLNDGLTTVVIAIAFSRADQTSQFVERGDAIMLRDNDILGTRVINPTAATKKVRS
jgi:hypothetical protein